MTDATDKKPCGRRRWSVAYRKGVKDERARWGDLYERRGALLDRVFEENIRLKARVRDLEKNR